MPAGMSFSKYIACAIVSILTMFSGSQIVHEYYLPLANLDEYIQREEEKRRNEQTIDK